MFRTAANHLRKEFTVFHHLQCRQAVEEGENTLFHGFQFRLVVVALHRHLVGSDDVFWSAKSRKAIFHSLLYETTYLENMFYQFHCLYLFIYCRFYFYCSFCFLPWKGRQCTSVADV